MKSFQQYKIDEGVSALRKGNLVKIYNTDVSGIELASAIKKQFVDEYTNRLTEMIEIVYEPDNIITIKFTPKSPF